ncbi:putative 2-dehydropantoate 2-reductase [Paenibacillus cisolokensis]|uniref:2-dehydropantoate 2-reductase n=1 Tax=Paenibacillus cisolokensis TaxID=1658519 RepID=A0ABQ4N7H5_9BACL|nr:2-dehydropantoate 2-reductase [Paenibacillus cisolokensis]GIQ64122.1 putative 2-dehydropantoate 2-reductase [Paenibacillus cisolokensis]
MEFHIVGGGSIGLLYAARLALAGYPATVWTRTEEQAAELNRCGIRLEAGDAARQAAVRAAPLSEAAATGPDQCASRTVLLAVKQPQLTPELLGLAGRLAQPGAAVLCLQNGIGHLERIAAAMPDADVYAAVTTEGARKLAPAVVRHTGAGELWFGPAARNARPGGASGGADGRHAQADGENGRHSQNLLLFALKKAGIDAYLSNDIHNRIYAKLLLNAVINPLTAIYGVRNGALPEDPARLRLMLALHKETEEVLRAAGMAPSEDGWKRLLDVCASTSANVSSMLADIRAGRRTEIDWINGGVSALARKAGLSSPLNDAMVTLVKALEQ